MISDSSALVLQPRMSRCENMIERMSFIYILLLVTADMNGQSSIKRSPSTNPLSLFKLIATRQPKAEWHHQVLDLS
jgi:hypothetical protein